MITKKSKTRSSLAITAAALLIATGCMLKPGLGLSYTMPTGTNRALAGNRDVQGLQKLSRGIAAVAKEANKALVFVSISKTVKSSPHQFSDPFEFFFGPRGRRPVPDEMPKQSGLGSGFFFDLSKGYVLTNNHVVEGADEITLKVADGKTYQGSVVGRDKNTDVAVVQIKDKDFKSSKLSQLPLANSDSLAVGEFVLALGAPYGLESSLSFGVVSALHRTDVPVTELGSYIQTDAAINPGNSGGPLLNLRGEVVGMNTAIYSRSGGSAGVGFAVPANLVRNVAEKLINHGKVDRGYIGVGLQPLDPDLSASLGLPPNATGALVKQVQPGFPADQAGLEAGDVIYEVAGKKIEKGADLVNAIGLKSPGDKVTVKYYRGGRSKRSTIAIGSWDSRDGEGGSSGSKGSNKSDALGLSVQSITEALARKFGFESRKGAVIVGVERGSAAEKAGLRPGDVVVSANGKKIRKAKELRRELRSKKRALLRIERQGEFYFIPLKR